MTMPAHKAWWRADMGGTVWQTWQAGTPYHNTAGADGQLVQVWDDVDGLSPICAVNTVNSPTYRVTTPLMLLPCIDFDGTNDSISCKSDDAVTLMPASAVFSVGAKTVIFSIYVESVSLNNAAPYNNHPVWADAGGYLGAFVRTSAGLYYIQFFNWQGNQTFAEAQIQLATTHVITLIHGSGNISVSVDGGTPVVVASGNTTSIANQILFGTGYGGQFYNGRLGEAVFNDTAWTGSTLTDGQADVNSRWKPAGATFNAAWNIAANTVIHGGAIAA